MHASVNVSCQCKSGPGKIHEVILVPNRMHFNITCIFIGARPHFAAEIKKEHSYISTGRPSIHTNPSENGGI